MAESDGDQGDKTEEATQHRRDELHREGQIFQSRELSGSILLFFLVITLYFSSTWILKNMGWLIQDLLSDLSRMASEEWSPKKVQAILIYSTKAFVFIFAPVAVIGFFVSLMSSVIQTGFVFSTKRLEFDLERLDPSKGFGRLFSMESIFELLKAIVKFVIVAGVLYIFMKEWIWKSSGFWELEPQQTTAFLGKQVFRLVMFVSVAMLIVSIGDYTYQKLRYEKSIKMSKQEIRDERKQVEGDPQIRARIRAVQRQVANKRMTAAVQKADVVITNPTHIAVALIYDKENMAAPRVVAKGADFMAERIKKIAREAGVPCVENVPLARALYKAFKIGHFISRDFYNAVAEVLAYVYRLRGGAKS
jgi:flagellar biosynthetic protein FlhB